MIAIVCVDQKNGMLFNHRRQSQDRVVRQDVLQLTKGKRLWMNGYSYKQFVRDNDKNDRTDIIVAQDFAEKAGRGEYCFIENQRLAGLSMEKLVLYRWDKIYPADVRLDINMDEWKLMKQSELRGYSHKTIVKEVYERSL